MSNYSNEELKNKNQALINLNKERMLNESKKIIQKSFEKKAAGLNERLRKIPEIYKNMKNNLTNTNNKELKKLNESIANTGNHTAGGYAISKRLNNINSFNKAQSDIDKAKETEITNIKRGIEDAKLEAEIESAKQNIGIYDKNLELALLENNRGYEWDFKERELEEEKRLNDSRLEKNEADIRFSENEDKRKNDENQREWELHNIETEFLPRKYNQELINLENDNRLTEEKIKTEGYKRSSKTTTGSGSGGKTEDKILSKMSAKDIADNIIDQVGSRTYNSYGQLEVSYSKEKATVLLLSWKKKFNLPDYIVNDAAIHLGIQSYF